jgi:hypothetical protein
MIFSDTDVERFLADGFVMRRCGFSADVAYLPGEETIRRATTSRAAVPRRRA